MKIEIQASGESVKAIRKALKEVVNLMDWHDSNENNWHVNIGTAQASAVVVQEEKEGE